MDRFQGGDSIENGGMFTREKIQQLTQKLVSLYGKNGVLEPADLARCMIDTYRGMNKHFIPTGYELSSFARVFDRSKKGKITEQDVQSTASRMFLANNTTNTNTLRGF